MERSGEFFACFLHFSSPFVLICFNCRSQRVRTVAADGVYSNNHFMYAATSLVGNTVRIQTASGNVWEGVFRTFSHQFDIVLEVAAKVENPNSKNSSLMANSLAEKIIFKSSDVISISIKDVDLEYAVRDTFQTDSAISAKFNGKSTLFVYFSLLNLHFLRNRGQKN